MSGKIAAPPRAPKLSLPELTFQTQLKQAGVRGFIREYKFHPKRRWRLDFADPSRRIGVELMGATWTAGRHTRGAGYMADCEKANEAICYGWRLLRATTEQVNDGRLLAWVLRILE
jgi:hypothetical protein